MIAKKLILSLVLFLLSVCYLFSFGIALGAEAQYAPSIITIGDSSSFFSTGSIASFTALNTNAFRYSISLGIEKGLEHYSFHRFSRLSQIASLFSSCSVGYFFNNASSINIGFGIKCISIGLPPYNIRVMSSSLRMIYRKEYRGNASTPDFFLIVPVEVLLGKTAKGVSLGIGGGYSFSHEKGSNR